MAKKKKKTNKTSITDKVSKIYKFIGIFFLIWTLSGLALWGAYHNQNKLPKEVKMYLFKDFGRSR